MKYKMLNDFLKRVEKKDDTTNNRNPVALEEIQKLEKEYPHVPVDYFDFLKEIGAGSFRECQFNVYAFLISSNDFEDEFGFTHDFGNDINFLIFGDNFSGDWSAFNLDNNYSVIELWHDSCEIYETNLTFKKYMEETLLMAEDGSDLRAAESNG